MSRKSHLSSAKDLEQAAAAWVFRRDAGLSGAEAAEFERWLAADPRHRDALDRHAQTWSTLVRPRQAGQVEELVHRIRLHAGRRRRRRIGTASLALVVFLGAGLFWHRTMPERFDAGVSSTGMIAPERQTLPDGSQVELKAGAEIAVDFSPDSRRVVLKKGEAHFQVMKSDRPFVVAAGTVDFRAVGTAFAVQIGKTEVQLLVTEGQVAVETAAVKPATGPQDAARRVSPPDVLATVGPSKRMVIGLGPGVPISPPTAIPAVEMAERLAWRAPRLEFTDTPLAEAVALMNRYNRRQFVILEADAGKLQVSGIFRADRIDSFVQLLETNFSVIAESSEATVGLRLKR